MHSHFTTKALLASGGTYVPRVSSAQGAFAQRTNDGLTQRHYAVQQDRPFGGSRFVDEGPDSHFRLLGDTGSLIAPRYGHEFSNLRVLAGDSGPAPAVNDQTPGQPDGLNHRLSLSASRKVKR